MFSKKGLNIDGFLYLTLNEFEKTKILELIYKDYVPIYQSRYKDNLLLGFVIDKLCLPINGRKLDYYDNLNHFMNHENIFICAFDNFNGKYYSATVPFKQFFLFLDVKENMCMDTVINLTQMNQGIIEEYTENDESLNTFHEISSVDTFKDKLERKLSKKDMTNYNQLNKIDNGVVLGFTFLNILLIILMIILMISGVNVWGLLIVQIFLIIVFNGYAKVMETKYNNILSKYKF